jgi:hypothetical protein
MNQTEFSKEQVQIASKYMKKSSTSLVIKELQHIYFISPQLEWSYSRAVTTTNAGKNAAEEEPFYTVGGNAN